jgi:translation elongation factor P/translation initiation factor 5A
MDNTSFEQFSLSLENIGENQLFLKDGTDVDVLYFNDNASIHYSSGKNGL